MELVKFNAPELQAIEESKAEQIKKTFEPMAEMLSEFEDQYNKLMSIPIEEMTEEITGEYKRLRLDIGKVRIETGKLKDKQKEYIKLEDKAIMGVHNILVWAVKEKEDKLKERENYFEIQEQKRLEKLQSDRVEKISKYVEDAHERSLSGMDDDVWNAYFNTKKKEYEDRIAAEKKAEEDRIQREKDEVAERLRIKKENEQLKKEAEKKEKIRLSEEKKRKEKEEKERKLREEQERKQEEIYQANLEKERKEKERIANELKAKKEAEEKAVKEELKRVQDELNKGDTDKVKDLKNDLNTLKTKYTFKSEKNNKMYSEVGILIDKIINYIK